MNERKELQILAAFVHGWLAFGHLLGLAYNIKKGNRLDAILHSVVLAYDLSAVAKHAREVVNEPHP